MLKRFYDCSNASLGTKHYSEFLLTDSEEMSRRVKAHRDCRYQAVASARIGNVPDKETGLERDEDAKFLRTVPKSSVESDGPHRHDRVIILRRGDGDEILGLIRFFEKWIPRLIEEERIFVTVIPKDLGDKNTFCNAMGRCQLVK